MEVLILSIICQNCGTANADKAMLCHDCGLSLRHPPSKPAYQESYTDLEGIDTRYYQAFVGRRAERYIAIWKKQETRPVKIGFHPVALFAPTVWLAYRRMLKYMIITLVFTMMATMLILLLATPDILKASRMLEQVDPITITEVMGDTTGMTTEQLKEYAQSPEVQERFAAWKAYEAVREESNSLISRWIFRMLALLLGIRLLLALFADHLYYRYAHQRIQMVLASKADEKTCLVACRSAGGVKPLYILIECAVSFVCEIGMLVLLIFLLMLFV